MEEPIVEAEPAPVVKESEPEPAGPVPPDEVVAELHAKYEEALAIQAEGPHGEAHRQAHCGLPESVGAGGRGSTGSGGSECGVALEKRADGSGGKACGG